MPVEVIMPKVDMDMSSGKITTWHVAEGDFVDQGTPLFDIETDKAAMEVEAASAGHLHHLVALGTDVPIGQPVGWLYAEGEEVGAPPVASVQAPAPRPAKADADPPEEASSTGSAAPALSFDERPASVSSQAAAQDSDASAQYAARATPKARAMAREAGLDLEHLTGSGPLGRIQAKDVEAATAQTQPPLAPAPGFTPQSGPLAVTHRPGRGTPMVMLHGFTGDAKTWIPIEPMLGDAPLYSIELPCHGASPHQRVRDFPGLVSDVRRAFDALGLGTVHLVGHSLGGALALALADTRPRSVSALSLLAPAGLGPQVNGAVLDGLCRANQPQSLAPWLRELVGDPDMITDAFARFAMAERADPAMRAAQTAMARALFADDTQCFDLRAALDRVTCRTQIIWGKDDRILPWRHALGAKGRIALHLFDGMGHVPHLEAPDDVADLIMALR